MIRRITALFFFLGVYVLGFAENTRGREYILVLSSINFNEAWANNLYQNILDEFSSPGFHVEAEELSIPNDDEDRRGGRKEGIFVVSIFKAT